MTSAPLSPLSNYLHHLSLLAKEERDRFRGVPPFTVLFGLAAFTHIALITPLLLPRNAEPLPPTRQVRLAFGVEKVQPENMMLGKEAALFPQPMELPQPALAPSPTRPATRTVPVTSKTATTPKKEPQQALPVARRPHAGIMSRPDAPRTLRSLRGGASGSGTGYGGDIVGSPDGIIVSKYEQLLSGWINSHRLNQVLTLPTGTQGRVVVRLRINRRGYVIFKTIEQSSGIAQLDKAAIDVVTRASPVPAVPEEYPGGGQLEFLIPINFVVN